MAVEIERKIFYTIALLDYYGRKKLKFDIDNGIDIVKLTDNEEDDVRLRFVYNAKHIPQANIIWLESKGKLNIINFDKRSEEFIKEGILVVSKYPNDIDWGNSPVPMIINNIDWRNVSDCKYEDVIDTIMVNKIIVQPNSIITGYKDSKNFTINNIIIADGKVKSQQQSIPNQQVLNNQQQVANMFQQMLQQSGMQNTPVIFDTVSAANNVINELNASVAANNTTDPMYEGIFAL